MTEIPRVNQLLFYDGGPCLIEANPFIYKANQWTGFCKIGVVIINWLSGAVFEICKLLKKIKKLKKIFNI